MPTHYIIDASSLLHVQILWIIPKLAALRTQFLPQKKRCCPSLSFFNIAADLAYVGSHLAYGKSHSTELSDLLEKLRLGQKSFDLVSLAILDALGLHDSYFPKHSLTTEEFPHYFLSLKNEHDPANQRRAMALVEQALNAQLEPNQSAITACIQFISEHTEDTFSLVNTSIFSHVAHICALLQKAGLNVHPAQESSSPHAAKRSSRIEGCRQSQYFLHSSCMYESHPKTFITTHVLTSPTEQHCYLSQETKKIQLMRSAGLSTQLIDESFQETDPPLLLQCC